MKVGFWQGGWEVIKRFNTHQHLVGTVKEILNKYDLFLLEQL